jgi:hypothetical protein
MRLTQRTAADSRLTAKKDAPEKRTESRCGHAMCSGCLTFRPRWTRAYPRTATAAARPPDGANERCAQCAAGPSRTAVAPRERTGSVGQSNAAATDVGTDGQSGLPRRVRVRAARRALRA